MLWFLPARYVQFGKFQGDGSGNWPLTLLSQAGLSVESHLPAPIYPELSSGTLQVELIFSVLTHYKIGMAAP